MSARPPAPTVAAAWPLTAWLLVSPAFGGEPPCDKYPEAKQDQCRIVWKELNDQAVTEIAQFGLAQQRKRDAGQLTPEQHLAENMAFIKHSTESRLKRLDERLRGK